MKIFILIGLIAASVFAHETPNKLLEKTVALGAPCYILPEASQENFICNVGHYSTGVGAQCVYTYEYKVEQKFKTIIVQEGQPVYEFEFVNSTFETSVFRQDSGYYRTSEPAIRDAKDQISLGIRSLIASKEAFSCNK